MNHQQVLQTLALFSCCILMTCIAYPADNTYDSLCSLCYYSEDPDICNACVLGSWPYPVEKRGPVFNPLLRGRFPKKSTYIPYYNPLSRGSYNKKSPYRPSYHPFLRGGYGGSYSQPSQP